MYNGWTNYETWNVALWVGNDEGFYRLARRSNSFAGFVSALAEVGVTHTPDGVAFDDPAVDADGLDPLFDRAEEVDA